MSEERGEALCLKHQAAVICVCDDPPDGVFLALQIQIFLCLDRKFDMFICILAATSSGSRASVVRPVRHYFFRPRPWRILSRFVYTFCTASYLVEESSSILLQKSIL
mmetsp:Transcript_34483/g.67842  ORF Transcript_34483/g.67842 Transcript_34483/m.67842 type:complete len:107 (+) Transcript_34483:1021-1341(+)